MTNLPDYIQNACDWANMQGWKVFPTNPNTKRPCIKDPFGRAVNTREEVIDLFKDFPGAGIGIPTGPSNGITVVEDFIFDEEAKPLVKYMNAICFAINEASKDKIAYGLHIFFVLFFFGGCLFFEGGL